jgi:hypothetical protein
MSSPPTVLDQFKSWAQRTFFEGSMFNTLQPPVPHVFLWLQFIDPEGKVRDFPPGYPVQVRFGDGATAQILSPPVAPGGRVTFEARTSDPWQYFTLLFNAPDIPYIVCEPLGSPPASPPGFQLAPGLAGATANRERFFSLPKQWELIQGDWSPPVFTNNGRADSPPGKIYHTKALPADISMGTPGAPVRLVLKPHWHFLRYEFFDRYYGNANLDSPPRPAHQKRVSIPQVAVEGYRTNPNAAGPTPDTHSNWAIDLGSKSLLQSLPFILRRDAAGAQLSPPDGSKLGLRMRNPAGSVVYSQTDQERVIAVSPPPAPSPDRLRYYDLPQTWKSRNYYTRRMVSSPPAPGKFFQTLPAGEIASAEQAATPLVFSLDDIVLCVGNSGAGATGVLSPMADAASSPPTGRVAIFNHRFDDRLPSSSAQGLYKLLSPPGPDDIDLPRSDVAPVRNYIFDYPDWTRLIACRGNLFDVFDQRTGETFSPPGAVGARAAVRYIDASQPYPGITTFTWNAAPPSWIPVPGNAPIPGAMLQGGPPAVVAHPGANPLFAIQPFYQQQSAVRYRAPYSAAASEQIGRYDIALLRCCDVQSGNEVAINLNYLRSSFNFAVPPAVPPNNYAQSLSQNVANRWSGNDPGINEFRTRFVPRSSPPAPLRVDAIWFPQSVAQRNAHFRVDLWNQSRDDRGSQSGNGHSGPDSWMTSPNFFYAAAHETGHMGGMPDEYNERWWAASYDQISFKQNLPGDPYEPDGRNESGTGALAAMMNGVKTMRNRYFWHNAEWVRQLTGTPLKVIYQDIGGSLYDNYWLPPHPTALETYYPWPINGLLNQSISPPAPPAPVPPVAYPMQWGRYDLYLYALGKDHYAANIISAHATMAAPFDAILVIALKITCVLPATGSPPNLANEDSWRQQALQHLAAGVRTVFNNQWGFSGASVNPAWTIQKGLIHVVPQFVVENHPFDATRSPPSTQLTPLATSIQNTFGVNYQLRVDWQSPPNAIWSPPGRRLVLNMQSWAALDGLFGAQIPRMLGINKAVGAVTAADLQPVVQLVLPGAVVRQLP